MARSSNTSILFLPAKNSGLALPSLVRLYKNMHATMMVQLFRLVTQQLGIHLSEEKERQRLKFRPAALSYIKTIPSPVKGCKTMVAEVDDDERHQSLCLKERWLGPGEIHHQIVGESGSPEPPHSTPSRPMLTSTCGGRSPQMFAPSADNHSSMSSTTARWPWSSTDTV